MRMQLRYDEEFVEAAVLLCATGRRAGASALQVRRFHRERERLYSVLDPDERNAAFFRLYLEWFREWGLEQSLNHALAEYPPLAERLDVLAFRQARGKSEEGAELYVNEGDRRHGVVALRVARLECEPELAAFLRHELMHLADMVDPAFGYSPSLPGPSLTVMEQRLVRERYRVLWDVSIDGRLCRRGRPTVADRAGRWAEFERGYGFWAEAKQREVFEALWNADAPAHAQLQRLASDPRDLKAARQPIPGAACPLCGFPTFQWIEGRLLVLATAERIQTEFPQWLPEHGLCARCAEIYASASMVALGAA